MLPGRRTITASAAPTVTVPVFDRVDIAFVTVTFGTGPIVIDMLRTLVDSLPTSTWSYEVIVVDNPHPTAPNTPAVDLSLHTSGVRVVSPDTNVGFGGGCELGALHTAAPYIGFVNPDIEFESGWIEPLIERLTGADDAPSIVAPALVNPDGTIQEVGQRLDADGLTWPITSLDVGGDMAVDYASAACWLMRRDDVERLGGFDADYHPAYYEDVDLALRARAFGGGTLVDPSVAVIHHRGHGTAGSTASPVEQHAMLLRKWPSIRWRQLPAPHR